MFIPKIYKKSSLILLKFLDINIEFSTSSRGALCLIYNGQRFLKAYSRRGKTYWICGISRDRKCPASITQDTRTNKLNMTRSNVHNHIGNVRSQATKRRGKKQRTD